MKPIRDNDEAKWYETGRLEGLMFGFGLGWVCATLLMFVMTAWFVLK